RFYSAGGWRVLLCLELINDVGGNQDSVLFVRKASPIKIAPVSLASGRIVGAARLMVPADFQPAEDVLPKIILDRPSQGEDPCWQSRRTASRILPEILATSVEAQLFGGLEGRVERSRVGIVRTDRRLIPAH